MKKTDKEKVGKVAAAIAALDELTLEDVRTSDDATLWKLRETAHNWEQLAIHEHRRRRASK